MSSQFKLHPLLSLIRPFHLATANNFAALPRIKFLEDFVETRLEQLLPLVSEWQKKRLSELAQIIKGFDKASLETKRQMVEQAKNLLDSLWCPPANWQVLFTSLDNLPEVKGRLKKALKKRGCCFLLDVLFFLPLHYEDLRHFTPIRHLKEGQTALIKGRIVASGLLSVKKGQRRLYKVAISDGTGVISGIWFNYKLSYMQSEFKKDREVIFSGQVKRYGLELVIHHPEVFWETSEFRPGILPVYSELEGIYPKQIRRVMSQIATKYAHFLGNPLPLEIQEQYRLWPLWEAVLRLHQPSLEDSIDALNKGSSIYHQTLKFLELFLLELALALKRQEYQQKKGIAFKSQGGLIEAFLNQLPFRLTLAQRRAVSEILSDMESERPMHRLLQGDVGSGKTVVALIAALKAIECGYQVAVMAPTEILAQQHFNTFSQCLEKLNVKVTLLVSHLNSKVKEAIKKDISLGNYQLVVGTHALIQEDVDFSRLGLVIIDEQHRFGVAQRAELIDKANVYPDVLVMTATPIPRTLSLTLYGDLDISIIDEMPPGRLPVKTMHFWEDQRNLVYEFIKQQLKEGAQVYVVYPLIEESEKLELKAATTMFKEWQQKFEGYQVGLLHGRMKPEEKQRIMQQFYEGLIHILVSTTVIEVGVDVPKARVMVIEHAERFGLAQLHQLRGRVGRRGEQAYCLLITPRRITSIARSRLQVMVSTTDGFKIAEADLKLRGPGEVLGTRQSGFPEFRFVDLTKDLKVLKQARDAALNMVAQDPLLKATNHQVLKEYLKHLWGKKLRLALIG